MRRLVHLLGAALLLSAPARAADCTGVTFADMPWLRFGKPTGASLAFSGGKQQVPRGEFLALGPSSGAQVCAERVKGQGAGWLPADALDIVARVNDTGSFVGAWRRGAAQIRIHWLDDGRLSVEASGAGSFAGDMDMRDGIGLFFGEGVDPDAPDAQGCRVRMARGGEVLVVRDNGQCGGGFGGTYAREKEKAATR
jgi:hypothetical protein